MSHSKLMIQLEKEKKKSNNNFVDQERIQDIFAVLAKLEPKNLMLIELIVFMIEKGFIKNSQKIFTFMDIYQSIKNSSSDGLSLKNKNDEEDKFSKDKFSAFLKEIAVKIYPGNPNAYQTFIYNRIVGMDDDQRLKIQEVVKRILSKETINKFRQYNSELQTVFQIYIPQNFNSKMGFNWQQLRFLQKKIPILSAFRFLWQTELIPHYISPTQYFQMASKLIPPLNSNHKEVMFYYSQTINNYVRDSISLKSMKVLDGDIGLTFFQFEILLCRIALQFAKQIKNDCTACLEKLLTFIKLKEVIAEKGEYKGKQNKFQESVKNFFDCQKGSGKNNFQAKKRQTKKKIQEILEAENFDEDQTKNNFKDNQVTKNELLVVKKSLDEDQLPAIPPKSQIQKQNDQNYNIQSKHIVIGEQLPKIQEKNKAAAPKKNDKKDQNLNKFKFEEEVVIQQSTDHYGQLMKRPKKMRVCNEFPIILTQTLYPNDIPNIYINPKAQIYLETTYIHLGQKQYENAFMNFCKAKMICQPKTSSLEFYFAILQAQIYECAGKDGISLLCYHKAKEIVLSSSKDKILLSYAYRGIGSCLYHVQQYEYAFRCYLKIRQIRSNQLEQDSVENALLENNIGCCLMMLNRHTQAHQNFKLSERIFDLRYNKLNQKTLVAQQNASKNKKAYIELVPQFKTMWRTYEEKPNKGQNNAKPTKGKK